MKGKSVMRKVAKAAKSVVKKVGIKRMAKGAKKAASMASRMAKGKY